MSVQELLQTHDCSVPGCPDEAREAGGVCRYHATNAGPALVAPGSHAHLMEEEPPVNTCKMPGCTNPSAGKGGWTSGLCQGHISEGMRRRQATVKARRSTESRTSGSTSSSEAKKPEAAARPTPQPKRKAEPRSRIAPTITTGSLVQLATECEAAEAALTAARLRHETAIAALRSALDAAA